MRFIGQGNGKWHLTQKNVNVYTLVMQTQNTSIQWEHRRLRTRQKKRSRGSNQPVTQPKLSHSEGGREGEGEGGGGGVTDCYTYSKIIQ